MIKLYDALLTDIMTQSLMGSKDMEAYALTIRDAIRLLLDKSEMTMIYKNFDKQPDEVIDLMAAEFRTQYYDELLDLNKKRELVKNTLKWYLKAGTDGAVTEFLDTVFGNGKIIPWYMYAGKPWHVKIVANVAYSEDNMEKFATLLKKVKKSSTFLDAIITIRTADMHIKPGGMIYSVSKPAAVREGTESVHQYIDIKISNMTVIRPPAVREYNKRSKVSITNATAVYGYTKPAAVRLEMEEINDGTGI